MRIYRRNVHNIRAQALWRVDPEVALEAFVRSSVLLFDLFGDYVWRLSPPSWLDVIDGSQMQARLRPDLLAAYNAVSARLIDSSTLTSESSSVIPNDTVTKIAFGAAVAIA
ncbi:MAG: hypothetical protein WC581_04800, partial [Thermodesulfovibrionales bacterium]